MVVQVKWGTACVIRDNQSMVSPLGSWDFLVLSSTATWHSTLPFVSEADTTTFTWGFYLGKLLRKQGVSWERTGESSHPGKVYSNAREGKEVWAEVP